MATQSTPAQRKDCPVKCGCQTCSVSCNNIQVSPAFCPVQGVVNEDHQSRPSVSNGVQTSPTREYARSSSTLVLGCIFLVQIVLIIIRCFLHGIDFGPYSIFLRPLNPRWAAGTFSISLVLWLATAAFVDGRKPTSLRAEIARVRVESHTNMLLRQLIGCFAASTLTDDVVTLYFHVVFMNVWPNLPVHEWENADSEMRWAEGIVIMAITFLLAMVLVILAWITVVAVSLGLPHAHLQKKAKHCTQAKGHSPALKRKGINHGVRELTQYVRGAMYTSSHFLRKTLFQRITMYLGFALYATVAVIVHLLKVDRKYSPLSHLPFSAHLTWLTTTSSFCFFIWLATLLNHSKTVPELRADVAFALVKSKSTCSSIDKIGTIASCILIADSILTVEWPIKILYELMPVYETGDFASILVWVGFWIICIVAASLGLVVNYGLNMPLDAFRGSIEKCQQDMAKDASPKALGAEPKTEKPRSASIVSKDGDLRSSNAPVSKSSTSTSPITESRLDIQRPVFCSGTLSSWP